jgi:hypothetical protein
MEFIGLEYGCKIISHEIEIVKEKGPQTVLVIEFNKKVREDGEESCQYWRFKANIR